MKDLTLCGHIVRINDEGFVSLTDMWKASGGKRSKEPGKFLSRKDAKDYIAELNTQNLGGLKILKGRHHGGTWACKYIAYKYASWIDKAFEVGAYKVLDSYFSGNLVQNFIWQDLHEFVLDERYSRQLGSFHGKGLARRRQELTDLQKRHQQLLAEFQIKLKFNG